MIATPIQPLRPAEYLAHLARGVEAFAATLETGDLRAPVPACQPWDLCALAHHLGNVHRWARGAVVDRRPPPEGSGGPPDRAPLVAWYREGARALLETLRSTDPDAECWTFGPGPHAAAFWMRRQAHETAMHAFDAARSQKVAAAFDPRLALDGIDEVVRMFFPRQVRLERMEPLTDSLALEPLDAPGARFVLACDGAGPESAQDAPAQASLRASAQELLLLLWGRLELGATRASVEGDREAANRILSARLTP
jgi:uncharacterized protein (TIGR03083 family)